MVLPTILLCLQWQMKYLSRKNLKNETGKLVLRFNYSKRVFDDKNYFGNVVYSITPKHKSCTLIFFTKKKRNLLFLIDRSTAVSIRKKKIQIQIQMTARNCYGKAQQLRVLSTTRRNNE